MKRSGNIAYFLFSVAVGALVYAPSARAALTLELTDTSCGTVGGGGPCDQTFSTASADGAFLTEGGMVGHFSIISATGSEGFNPSDVESDTVQAQLKGVAGGTLIVTLSDTGFISPTGPNFLINGLTLLSNRGGMAAVSSVGTSVQNGGSPTYTTSPQSLGPVAAVDGTKSNTVFSGPFTFSAPYTMKLVDTITVSGCGGTAATECSASVTDNMLVGTPEPASIFGLTSILALLYIGNRFRRARA